MISTAKVIKRLCLEKDTNPARLAAQLDMTKSNMYTKFRTDNMRVSDIEKSADALGYDIVIRFVDRENGKVIEFSGE